TIKELYEDAIKYEESLLAHYIFFLLQEGEISLESDKNAINYQLANSEEFRELYKSNVLGFDQIKIYSLKQDKNTFAFIYAKSEEEAIKHYRLKFRKEPLNCHELSMDQEMAVGNRFINFRDWKKEFKQFPVFVGFYEKS